MFQNGAKSPQDAEKNRLRAHVRAAMKKDKQELDQILQTVDKELLLEGNFFYVAIIVEAGPDTIESIVKRYKQLGLSIETPKLFKRSPLEEAFFQEYMPSIEVLIKAGSDYTSIDPNSNERYLDIFLRKHPKETLKIKKLIAEREKPAAKWDFSTITYYFSTKPKKDYQLVENHGLEPEPSQMRIVPDDETKKNN